ncbi:hypothetical protein M409DRAFT_63966 [Zasmidium cellare ATCC 36951]|uniref:FAD-binding domain-containing protein n=1 Tax=Zasmidium cellare ATCC 36951 TaxID=1080233 RepID=A0A6A6CUW1_ZASCE|nr:uncharacterized protein M409DRAFT_63966 [Zasmidium cellare ATCC 36951]KAF2170957.1 hypothetical protein M409DRAFT_63966 [Zasmidium cellare ATCC 36951]
MASSRKRNAAGEVVQNGGHSSVSAKQVSNMSPGKLNDESASAEGICDVVVVGAGPAGLMLAANLVRFGIKTTIIDDRPSQTSTGRADGLQPKTIETLKQMRLADNLLKRGVRIHDICFWSSTAETPLRRTSREVHYPPVVDLLDPYILLVHQGMVEDVFLEDLQSRGVNVVRNAAFSSYSQDEGDDAAPEVLYDDLTTGNPTSIRSRYLVGCDGAHSKVRKSMGVEAEGASSEAIWGVLDGEIESDFPDLWSKAVVYSHKYGNVLCIPRERGMTRLYIELKSEDGSRLPKERATKEFVMEQARLIFQPYGLQWTSVEWFGIYQIGQRVARHFTDASQRVFIAGDASHTHSPKAAQGMNTSMHDSLNLAWKLNLAVRGLAKPHLLETYEHERRKVAQDLINFDFEHANSFHAGDPEALAQNFLKNIRFISGVGAEYTSNILNKPSLSDSPLQPGQLLTPVKATRYLDANPVDLQLDIPMLGQFRMYLICPDILQVKPFLEILCDELSTSSSTSASALSYTKKPRTQNCLDEYVRPERYLTFNNLITPTLITATPKAEFEISDLPQLLRQSPWTVYLDDCAVQNKDSKHCFEKWVGCMAGSECAVVNVRPDGYIGHLHRWDNTKDRAVDAANVVHEYYSSFLEI